MNEIQNERAYELARAEVMLRGYDARWAADAASYDVLGVEEEFRCAVVNPATGADSRTWTLAGKLDVRVREVGGQGRVLVVEHKTTSEDCGPGSAYLKRLRMDAQVSLYYDGGTSLGHVVEGVLYDVLVKFGQRPLAVPEVEDGAKVVLAQDGSRVRTKDGKKWRETGDAAQGFGFGSPTTLHVMAEAMRLVSPLGRLSRQTAGTIDRALVLNLPGSTSGCIECLDAVLDVLPHALELLRGDRPH